MQQSSPLSDFLLLMEQPAVVIICILLVIGVRLLWVAYRKANPVSLPLPPAPTKGKRTDNAAAAPKPPLPNTKDWILECIDTLLIALILVFGLLRPFMLQTFFIPSDSMVPTLLKDDKLIANKFVLRFRPPQRGEVIVFTPPVEAVVASGASPDTAKMCLRAWIEANPNKLHQLDPALNED